MVKMTIEDRETAVGMLACWLFNASFYSFSFSPWHCSKYLSICIKKFLCCRWYVISIGKSHRQLCAKFNLTGSDSFVTSIKGSYPASQGRNILLKLTWIYKNPLFTFYLRLPYTCISCRFLLLHSLLHPPPPPIY